MQSKINSLFSAGLISILKQDVIVDPDTELIYTKRKIVREQAKSGKETVPDTCNTSTVSQHQGKVRVNYPTSGWGIY